MGIGARTKSCAHVRMTERDCRRRPYLDRAPRGVCFPPRVTEVGQTVADDLPGAADIWSSRRAPTRKWNPMLNHQHKLRSENIVVAARKRTALLRFDRGRGQASSVTRRTRRRRKLKKCPRPILLRKVYLMLVPRDPP